MDREWPSAKAMGRSSWVYDEDLDMHVPCCTRRVTRWIDGYSRWVPCGNGPLTGDQIDTGDCGEHPVQPRTV